MKQLILQVSGACGNNHFLVGGYCGHQISKGFTNAGARLGNQYLTLFNHALNFSTEILLTLTRLEALDAIGKDALLTE